MKLLLEIPDAFAEHFAMDKFKDSFMRICGDLGEIAKSHSTPGAASLGLSGRYEKELVDVLAPAFARAVVVSGSEHAKRVKQVLRAEYQRAVTEVQFWDTILQTCPHYRNRYFDRRERRNERNEIAVTKESRKTIANLYKRYKYRGQVALAQKDILSAYVTRFDNGKRELYIVPVAGKGSPVSVSIPSARG